MFGDTDRERAYTVRDISLKFRKGDWLAIVLVAVCAALAAVGFLICAEGESPAVAQIYLEGQLLREVPLSRDESFAVTGACTNVITVSGGKIAVMDSDCPGKDCVHRGWISGGGESIVCLPNNMEIRLTGAGTVDAVSGVGGAP